MISDSLFRSGLLTVTGAVLLAWPARAEEPKLRQSTIKGLLVVQLDNGSVAGAASQMNATVVPGKQGSFSIGFNQKVGGMMGQATVEVEKFIRVRHGKKLPLGHRIELAFADKYSPKDGPSAAVVCALLADSIITGAEIDPGFAATGDMTATGEVRPVGGILGKIRGAVKKDCKLIGIPQPNEKTVSDLSLMEGMKPLYEIQIFRLETFEEARRLAVRKRDEDTQKAINDFALVQKALKRDEKLLTNAKVLKKLRDIVKLAPNHLSARLLYLQGVRKGPKALSLPGSLVAIDEAAASFMQMIADQSFLDTGQDDVLTDLIWELKRLRPMLDARTKAYYDAYEELASYVKSIRGKKVMSAQIRRELSERSRRVNSERRKLLNDEEVREELMLE